MSHGCFDSLHLEIGSLIMNFYYCGDDDDEEDDDDDDG